MTTVQGYPGNEANRTGVTINQHANDVRKKSSSNSPDSTTGGIGLPQNQQTQPNNMYQPSFLAYSAGDVPKTGVAKDWKQVSQVTKSQNPMGSHNPITPHSTGTTKPSGTHAMIATKPPTPLTGTASAPLTSLEKNLSLPLNIRKTSPDSKNNNQVKATVVNTASTQNNNQKQLPLREQHDENNHQSFDDEERVEKLMANVKPEAPPCNCFHGCPQSKCYFNTNLYNTASDGKSNFKDFVEYFSLFYESYYAWN